MPTSPPASRIHLHNPSTTQAKRTYIIYFITGNPGLIEYYRTFLTHIYGLLTQSSPSSTSFHVFGRSLSGFEASTEEIGGDAPPFSLQEQISRSQGVLEELVHRVKKEDGVGDVRVILMGHSVGSFILLELTRRIREKVKQEEESMRIVGGICLFPTVMHIAKSDSGKKATPLLTLPYFPRTASILASALTCLIPLPLFTFLVRKVLSFPQDAAHITASFVKSPHGVYQALHMACDEMREITIDTWDGDIWGLTTPTLHPHPRPILRFLFAKKDHWVADETRDELIKARGSQATDGSEDGKPIMEVDEDEGWVHGFCIRQSVPVAERVVGYVQEMMGRDAER